MSTASSYCSQRCSVIEAEGDQNIPVKRCSNTRTGRDYRPAHTHSYNTRLSAKFARPERDWSCDSAIFEGFLSDSVDLANNNNEMSLRSEMHMGGTHMNPCSDPCLPPCRTPVKLVLMAMAVVIFGFGISFLKETFSRSEDQILKRELKGIQGQIGQMKDHVQFVLKAKEDTSRIIGDLNKMIGDIKNIEAEKQGTCQRDTAGNCMDPVIQSAINQFNADKTGRPDYALESAGASIVSTRHTEDFNKGGSVSLFGWTLCFHGRGARAIIQPTVMPGECWAFRGAKGSVVIKLLSPIYITGITLEHIPKEIAPSKDVGSAPRDFSVIGLVNGDDLKGQLLGRFVYNIDQPPIQYFTIKRPSRAYVYVELKIDSNYGNVDYTCIYRVRIHGSEDKED